MALWQGYRKLLTGNGLQPGYSAILLFEFTVQKIRPGRSTAREEQQETKEQACVPKKLEHEALGAQHEANMYTLLVLVALLGPRAG